MLWPLLLCYGPCYYVMDPVIMLWILLLCCGPCYCVMDPVIMYNEVSAFHVRLSNAVTNIAVISDHVSVGYLFMGHYASHVLIDR